jgi:hypothetical protein
MILTRLICREDFIAFSLVESFKSYIIFMRFELLSAVKMLMLVFWVVTPCGLVRRYHRFGGTYTSGPEDGGRMFLRNIGVYLKVHTALQPRRPTSTFYLFADGQVITSRK